MSHFRKNWIQDFCSLFRDSQQKPPFGLSQCQVFFIATLVGMLLTGIALAAIITLYLENSLYQISRVQIDDINILSVF